MPFLPKVICFGPFERSKPFGIRFALVVPFVPKGFLDRTFYKVEAPLAFVLRLLYLLCRRFFWFGPFIRSKPLGVRFALFVTLVPKVFWFGPLKGRSPLAFFLHLLCLLCRRFFFRTFKRSKPLGFWISMQSLRFLHTLLTYCFLQHVGACRSLPLGLLRRR